MIGYRLYFCNSSQHILEREEFFAETEKDALGWLQRAFLGRAEFPVVELWEEKRFVRRLERVGSGVG